jgi:exonuclease III
MNDTIEQMDLTDIYRVVHQRTAYFTFFSEAHRTFSKVDHILGPNISLNKYKKTEIIP